MRAEGSRRKAEGSKQKAEGSGQRAVESLAVGGAALVFQRP